MLDPKGSKKREQTETYKERDESENIFWTPMRVKALIGLIIFMSVVLAVGFGFFIYKLVNTVFSNSATKDRVSIEALNAKTQSKPITAQSGIKLDGFKIQHLAASEQEIILYVKKQEISEIWVVNKKTKRVTTKINVQK